jgi:hypothetical protein
MAKTGFIATALLETSKGTIKPGKEVKGLPGAELKALKELGVVEEDIIKAKSEDDGSSDDGNKGKGSETDPNGSKTDSKTDNNGDK